ncbi:MFS transporter [Parafrigoribacterium soli]|uniref:MFS transporter n=1 Tax=Parafrigoribacterium soli TaxID=3144663 RepID=UPI0032EFEEF9
MALNLRTAVAAVSPIVGEIGKDITLTAVGLGVLGMLPPVCFALFGILTPMATRRASLELITAMAMVVVIAGHLLRAASSSFTLLVIGSVVAFAGMSVGNVLLPPLVKRYFPDRIGLVTSLYATVMAVSTFLPPLIAVPIADSAGWRVSLGMWALTALVAVAPWSILLVRARADKEDPTEPTTAEVEAATVAAMGRVWRTPVAWAIMVAFSMSSVNVYTIFAWLPDMLRDIAHATPGEGGALLGLYAAMGLPSALLVPVLAARMRNVGILIYAAVAMFLLGDFGLLLLPTTVTWLWVALGGLGSLLFPLALVLINARTRTHEGSVALSGFAQGVGYVIAAFGPLLFGVLHEVSGGWTLPLVFLILVALVPIWAGVVLTHPRMIEDEWHASDAPRPASRG